MRKRRKFTNEFKLEAVKLAEGGQVSIAQVARDLGIHESVLGRWIKLFGQRADGSRGNRGNRGQLPIYGGCGMMWACHVLLG